MASCRFNGALAVACEPISPTSGATATSAQDGCSSGYRTSGCGDMKSPTNETIPPEGWGSWLERSNPYPSDDPKHHSFAATFYAEQAGLLSDEAQRQLAIARGAYAEVVATLGRIQ